MVKWSVAVWLKRQHPPIHRYMQRNRHKATKTLHKSAVAGGATVTQQTATLRISRCSHKGCRCTLVALGATDTSTCIYY